MRPKIICHMTSSIDGRLHPSRWSPPAEGIDPAVLRGHYDGVTERFAADGWIVGRKTMSEIAKGAPRAVAATGRLPRETHVADRRGRNLAVGIDPKGRVHYGRDELYGDHVVAVLGADVPDATLAELRADGASYLFAGPDGHDLPRALDTLGEAFGARTLVLQGGARINGAFLQAGLIDEISLLVYPGLDGLVGVAGILEVTGPPEARPAAGHALRHLATETLAGGMVWLRYAVERAPAPPEGR